MVVIIFLSSRVSPLLASLIPWDSSSSPRSTITGAGFQLVDDGYFQTADVIDELLGENYISADTSLRGLRRFGCKLVPLLFGKTSCPLTQLCCRRLFSILLPLMTGFKDLQTIVEVKTHHLKSILSTVNAPADLLAQMQITLLRERILTTVSQYNWNDDDDDDVISDNYDEESDGEFW